MSSTYLSAKDNEISRIGFGCWQLAGDYEYNGRANGYGKIDTNEAIRAIHLALDNGINFFDTALSYGYGKSEEILGGALKSYGPANSLKPVICTKFGLVIGSTIEELDYGGGNLIKSVEASLKRLQVEQLDIILLHNPPDNFDFSTYDTAPFEQLIQQGKIKAYGVSARSQKGVANVLQSGFGSVIEAVYNPLDRRYENYFSDPAYKDKYLFISRVPLASGYISPATLTKDRIFPADDIRHNVSKEQAEWVTDSVRKLSFLNDLEGGIVVSALRFQLSNAYNTICIPGLKNTKQAECAIAAIKLGPLSQDVVNKIAEAVPEVFIKWR